MASLRKVLEKAGYLDPIRMAFDKFITKQRDKSDQDQFNQFMTQAIDEIRKTYSTQPEENISFEKSSKTRFGDLLQHLPSRKNDQPGGIIDEPGRNPIDLEQPEDMILGDAEGRKYNTISADEQRMKIQRSIADAIMKSGQLQNLDPNKLQQGTGLLELIGQSYTPKQKTSELKQFDTDKDLYEIDDEGNFKLIKAGIQESKDRTIGSYIGNDGLHYTKLYDPVTKQTREIPSEKPVRPPRGTTIKFEFPKPEKWKDFGSVINMINFKQDPTTGTLSETTPQEQKELRKVAQNTALGNMLPGAVNFMQSRIFNAWKGKQNMSQVDFEAEILEGLNSGELSPEEAQDLIDYNQFRPMLYDELIETVKDIEEGEG